MSKHPLGPWSLTMLDTLLKYSGAPVIQEQVSKTGARTISVLTTSPSFSQKNTESKSGVNNGGPTDVPSPATFNKVEWEVGRGYDYVVAPYSDSFGYTYYRSCKQGVATPTFGTDTTSINPQTIKDKAFNSFIRKQGPKFNGLAFLGEFASFKNDIRFVTDAIRGRHNEAYKLLVKNLVKFRKGSIKDLSLIISDHWLRYQFGIKPDLMDMEDLLSGFKEILSREPKSMRVTARYMEKELNASVPYIFGDTVVIVEQRDSTSRKVLCKFGGTIKQEYVERNPNALTLGLQIEDFVPAVWELLPFSWLVDYFSNIGDFLNLSALRRAKFINGWYVQIDEKTSKCILHPKYCEDSRRVILSSSDGIITRKTFAFNRQPVNLDLYVPEFRYEVPNLRQAANIVAVGAQMLLKPQPASRLLRRDTEGLQRALRG